MAPGILSVSATNEVFVRAGDNRQALANQPFVQMTNNAPLLGVVGQFIEVRLALIRNAATNQASLQDLTLYGTSSGFVGSFQLSDVTVTEGQDARFDAQVIGVPTLTYQWFVMWPWDDHFSLLPGETNSSLLFSPADASEDGTQVEVRVGNGFGETRWLGPATLTVDPN